MSEDAFFYICVFLSIFLALWLGWYSIIPVVVLSFCFSIYLYIDGIREEKTRKKNKTYYKRTTLSEVLLAFVVLSVIGSITITACMLLKSCVNNDGPSYERIERRTKIHTSEGDKMPTMDERGEYHNAGTGERQVEYGGSIEQQRDIKAAEKLIEDGY